MQPIAPNTVACGIKTNGRDGSDPAGKRKREARLKCRQRVGCLGRSEAGAISSAQFPDVRHDETSDSRIATFE
jgi:hypothetical protein